MSIYPDERQKSFGKFHHNKETVNGVSLMAGQKLFIDGRPALIIRAWANGIQTDHLVAVCAKPYGHIPSGDVAHLMMETELALDPKTPTYRDLRIRVANRQDNFDVMAYSDQLAKKYEDS